MPERILLVEDSPTQAEALRFLLVEAGFDAVVAHTAEQALDLLKSDEPIDAILSDIVMPGMSGYEFSRMLKADRGTDAPPLILITTLSDPGDIVRGLESGADNYVTKPYEPKQLLERVRQVIDNRRLRGTPTASRPEPPVEVRFMGSAYSITAGREQILDMLLSSFEELIRTTDELRKSKAELQRSHARAEDRADRLTRLQQVTEGLSRSGTSAEAVHVVIVAARDALGADGSVAWVIGPEEGTFQRVEAVGFSESAVAAAPSIFRLESDHPAARAIRAGDLIVVSDPEAAGMPVMVESGHKTAIVAPLVVEGRTLGAWGMSFARPRRFEEADRQFILTLSRQFAQALDRARLFEGERNARAEAEEANRAKSHFLAAMSHDLRTPLNAIRGYVDLIEMGIRGPVSDLQREDLTRIKRSQEFLLTLINDVLNFAKFEAGTVSFNLVPVAISPLMVDLETMLRPQMEAKSLDYSWKVSRPGLTTIADEEKLQQVLLNLGTNALKFTPEGGRVTVTSESDGSHVLIRVQDSGIGIPQNDLLTIFDPFVQVHSPTPGTREGFGLGLAISRELVRGMGGELTVESELEVGSTFTLSLPVHADSVATTTVSDVAKAR